MNAHLLALLPALTVLLPGPGPEADPPAGHLHDSATPPRPDAADVCVSADTTDVGSAYYRVDLRPPASALGGRDVAGRVEVSYPPSPFGLPLDRDGVLVQRLRVVVDERWRGTRERLVAWVAPPDLDPVRRLGEIGPDGTASGEVAMNKFLVFVTEEPADATDESRWQGTVVLKGKSRSGRMQSMASHGMFEPEPC